MSSTDPAIIPINQRIARQPVHAADSAAASAEQPVSRITRRFEYKYQLDMFAYYRIRNALRWATRADKHSARVRNGRYFVRSLYYDTYNYQAYTEKVIGIANRIKLRIRSYSADRQQTQFVRIELKTKFGVLCQKFSDRITLADYDQFLNKKSWLKASGPVPDEFRRLVLLGQLRPMLLVDYHREAFVPLEDSTVRITFDHGLQFASASDLFPRRVFFHTAQPQMVIMEIKTGKSQLGWLEKLAQTHELKSMPTSKYAWGIEQAQHAVHRPFELSSIDSPADEQGELEANDTPGAFQKVNGSGETVRFPLRTIQSQRKLP